MNELKTLTEVFLTVSGYFAGIGLLVYGGVTGNYWACNVGLPLALIGGVPVAYQLAKSDPRWEKK